ncbi:aldo/keto reductase [Deinococcus aquatilis]|jgi:aryl-alcohol dehydrogenase-like predicted oxidoreductase|uniref:aldo/keto reductase n=1 Tax=Deinococcus aquatilis TaxID=519440 RepID=UPI000368D8C4|nr:aldo/keto reductase [Deinococcus aquatilis]
MKLTDFRTLGRSGLIVSPLALGTMTFGAPRWGSSDDVSESIFNEYVDAGGNFIDTADVYAGGRSEELVGRYTAVRELRDQLVLATKFTFGAVRGNPNASGNGRKNIHRALEGSLRRLNTDYIDLYWMHAWDTVTPVEEVVQSFGDLVRAGTIRYYGFSNVPAWYLARAATLAAENNLPGPVALQAQYSLVERSVEQELVPAARACGLGITPWSPLAAGFLSGKYSREGAGASAAGRLSGPNPFGDTKFTEHNWQVLDAVQDVAQEVERPPAQVALAWVLAQPGVCAPIVGASRVSQLRDSLSALDLHLTPEQLTRLNDRSVLDPAHGMTTMLKNAIFGGMPVQGWEDQ